MHSDRLHKFGGYSKARELFEQVADDMILLSKEPFCWRLVSQQIASADSICANIEEGYGRGSRKEFIQFLVFARGSTRETRGRYERFQRWLAPEIVASRVSLCTEILGILSATILTLRRKPSDSKPLGTRHPAPGTL